MKIEIKKKIYKLVKDINEIPKGEYIGVWCGYEVEFKVGDNKYMAQTIDGIRGMVYVKIYVTDSGIEIQ